MVEDGVMSQAGRPDRSIGHRRTGLTAALPLLAASWVAVTVCGVEPPATRQPAATRPAATGEPAPFTQPVAGTALSLEMVPVPGGTVTLQTAEGPREVTVEPFWIGATEVSWDLYDVFVYGLDRPGGQPPPGTDAVTRPTKPYVTMDRGYGHAGFPAISMSYRNAQAFCRWLSAKTGRTYSVPTEAQWRHVCALGQIDGNAIDEHAWHRGNARHRTHSLGSRKPDALGVHDLLGNTSEWCTGPDGEPVTMGGTFRDEPDHLGCEARVLPTEDWNDSDPQIPKSVWWLADASFVGMRLVCLPTAGAPEQPEESSP
jgi:formylglycine-generating enzyme required for sulfatase activity